MNQLYFKNLFYGSVISFFILQSGNISAQHPSASNHADRYDLIANINKVNRDLRNIQHLKDQISIAKKADNKKGLKSHREKLVLEKKVLKKDYVHAREQEASYKKNKSERIKGLEGELKASEARYEVIRSQIKKDLDKKNDFALQKDAAELLKAVQEKNEASTQLSMEKSDMIATVNAMDEAWKKVKLSGKAEPVNDNPHAPEVNLTTK